MTLNLYRRHGARCPGKRALHEMTYEADELRRTWKNCACPIYVSGTLGREFKRRNTERRTWQEAREFAAALEAAGRWDAEPALLAPVPAPAESPAPENQGVTIADAADSFLASRTNRGVTEPTMAKYRTFVKQLRAYCDSRGYVTSRAYRTDEKAESEQCTFHGDEVRCR